MNGDFFPQLAQELGVNGFLILGLYFAAQRAADKLCACMAGIIEELRRINTTLKEQQWQNSRVHS